MSVRGRLRHRVPRGNQDIGENSAPIGVAMAASHHQGSWSSGCEDPGEDISVKREPRRSFTEPLDSDGQASRAKPGCEVTPVRHDAGDQVVVAVATLHAFSDSNGRALHIGCIMSAQSMGLRDNGTHRLLVHATLPNAFTAKDMVAA